MQTRRQTANNAAPDDDDAPRLPDRPSETVTDELEDKEATGILDSWFFGRAEAETKLECDVKDFYEDRDKRNTWNPSVTKFKDKLLYVLGVGNLLFLTIGIFELPFLMPY